MGHLLLVSIRPPPATYVCPAAHLTYASAWPPAAVRPPGHPFVVCICWATCCTRARPAARDSRTSPRPLATLASSPDCMRPWHEPPAGRRAHVLHEPGRPPELLGRRSASAGGDYLRTIKAGSHVRWARVAAARDSEGDVASTAWVRRRMMPAGTKVTWGRGSR